MKDILSENGLLWAGTIFAGAHLGWKIWHGEGEVTGRILLWWAFWSFAVLWVTGTFFWHYFLQIVGPFSVLAAYGFEASWKLAKSLSPLPRLMAQWGWVILLIWIMAIFFIRTDYKYFFSYTPLEQTMYQHELSKGVFTQYGMSNVVNQQIALLHSR